MKLRSSDPLQCLPYEAWVHAIQFYARDQPEGPLPLLGVSSVWQRRLILAGELWTTIYLDGGHDEQCRAQCFFYLSGTFLVELVVGKNSAALAIAPKYRSRIKAFVFRAKWPEKYSSLDLSHLSSELGGCIYPNVADIYVEPPCDGHVLVPSFLIDICPALVGVHGAYFRQALSCMVPSTIIYHLLGDGHGMDPSSQPEILHLKYSQSWQENPGLPDYFTVPSTRLKLFVLSIAPSNYGYEMWLPDGRFEPFVKGSYYLRLVQAFTSTTHYALKVLFITIPWHEISLMIPCIAACTALRELALALDFSISISDPWHSPAATVADLGHLRKFVLYGVTQTWFSRAIAGNVDLIIQLLANRAPLRYLEELRLHLEPRLIRDSKILSFIRTTEDLKELHLPSFAKYRGYSPKKIFLGHLHTLVAEDESPVYYLEMPKLVCLTCRGRSNAANPPLPALFVSSLESITAPISLLHEWNDIMPSMPDRADGNPFVRLLTVRSLGILYKDPSRPLDLLNLRSITFEESNEYPYYRARLTAKSSINQFMLELLYSPDNCPRLHTIYAKKYPNWALATATFYRRNCSKRVTPVTSLWLPGYPRPTIVRLLVSALNKFGENPERNILAASYVDEILKLRWGIAFLYASSILTPKKHNIMTWIAAGNELAYSALLLATSSAPAAKGLHPTNPPDDPSITALLDLVTMEVKSKIHPPMTFYDWKRHLAKTELLAGYDTHDPCPRHSRQDMVHISPWTLVGGICDDF